MVWRSDWNNSNMRSAFGSLINEMENGLPARQRHFDLKHQRQEKRTIAMKRTFTLFATLSLVVSLSAASLYGTVWELTPRIKISQVTGLWQSGDIALHLFDDGHYEVDVDEDGVPDIRGEFSLSADQPTTIAIRDTDGRSRCPVSQVGSYWVERIGGILRLTVILDPCGDRGLKLSSRWRPLIPHNAV